MCLGSYNIVNTVKKRKTVSALKKKKTYYTYRFSLLYTHIQYSIYIINKEKKYVRPLIHDAGQWVRHTTDNIMETSIFYPV